MSSKLSALHSYLAETQSSIPIIVPSDENFEAVRACFVKRDADVPFAIVRPQNAEQVQTIVKYCTTNDVEFVVRSGGHDCAGRSQVKGVLTIDMRDIKHVRVNDDRKSAVVGGGVLFSNVTKELDSKGLITPVGTIATVGYVGWASLGGYGPFASKHGLGVDQILGAKIINAQGELVDAGKELLKGIRGGGGTLGVIVELTIKVYPLKELLVSLIAYESSDLQATWASFAEGYEALMKDPSTPRALQLQPFGMEFPGAGKVLAISATWADEDQEEGKKWFAKAATFGTCVMNNPESKSLNAFVTANEQLLTHGSYGRVYTVSVRSFTPKTTKIMAKYTRLLPSGDNLLSIHPLRAPNSSKESVFGSRCDHLMIELVAVTPHQEWEGKGREWALGFLEELKAADPENILEGAYVSLLGDDDSEYKAIYGEHYDALVELKKRYDPNNVFKYAVPRLSL